MDNLEGSCRHVKNRDKHMHQFAAGEIVISSEGGKLEIDDRTWISALAVGWPLIDLCEEVTRGQDSGSELQICQEKSQIMKPEYFKEGAGQRLSETLLVGLIC